MEGVVIHLKLQLETPTFIGTQDQVLATVLPIPLLANASGKATNGEPGT